MTRQDIHDAVKEKHAAMLYFELEKMERREYRIIFPPLFGLIHYKTKDYIERIEEFTSRRTGEAITQEQLEILLENLTRNLSENKCFKCSEIAIDLANKYIKD